MKRYIPITFLVLVGLLFGACAPPPAAAEPTAEPPAEPTAMAAPEAAEVEIEPRPGFTMGEMNPIPNLPAPDPAEMAEEQIFTYADARALSVSSWDPLQNPGGGTRHLLRNLWLSLLRLDSDASILPGLALAWQRNDDFTVYVFHLDPLAVWSDGTPITAQDPIDLWNFQARPDSLVVDPFWGIINNIKGFDAVNAGEATEIEGLVAVDDHTLEISLVEPDPLYVWKITKHAGAITPVKQVMEDPELWMTKPGVLASGPFMIEELDVALGNYVFVPNPNWWGHEPYLTEFRNITVEDLNTQLIMTENGELEGTSPALIAEAIPGLLESGILRQDPAPYYPGSIFMFFFRFDIPPTDDLLVRKALMHAIDLETVYEVAYGTTSGVQQMRALIPDAAPCNRYPEAFGYEYDPELAKEELAQSTYGSVENLPVIRMVANRGGVSEYSRAAEIILEMWKTNLGLTNVEFKGTVDGFDDDVRYDDEIPGDAGFDRINLVRISSGVGLPDTAGWFVNFFSPDSWWGVRLNQYHPELEESAKQAYRMQRDDPAYCETIQEIENTFWDGYNLVPLWTSMKDGSSVNVVNWVRNYRNNLDGDYYMLDQMWIAKQ
jgi:ABC-type transport system substrate-binding protein